MYNELWQIAIKRGENMERQITMEDLSGKVKEMLQDSDIMREIGKFAEDVRKYTVLRFFELLEKVTDDCESE